MNLIRYTLLTVLLTATFFTRAQIAVNTVTPDQAVDFLVGQGVIYSNVSFTGDPLQLGYFNGGPAPFEFESGIMISSEDAHTNVPGDFGTLMTTQVSGNADLLNIANSVPPLIGQSFSVSSANDVAILEFDFIPTGDTVVFNYIFGSDEYLTWVNSSYNDVFAFFISGPGIIGTYSSPAGFPDGSINIAFIPETDPQIPITISSVNNVLNSEYYIDNPGGPGVALNGFTVSMQAVAGVQCGQTYHIRLAIADGSDTALKSTVAFEEGSFASNTTLSSVAINPPTEDWPNNQILEGCVEGEIVIVIEDTGDLVDTLFLSYAGSATMGSDYAPLPDYILINPGTTIDTLDLSAINDGFGEGVENLIISFPYINGCGELDTASVEIFIAEQAPLETNVGNLTLCGPQTANSNVTGGFAPYNYLWSTNETTSTITINQLGDYDITVTDFCGQTFNESFNVVPPSGVTLQMDDEIFVCLNAIANPTVTMLTGANPPTCAWTGSSSTTTTATFDATDAGMQYVVVTDACGQTGTDSILVTIPTVLIGVEDLDLCVGVGTGELATGGTEPYTYTYDTDAFTPSEVDVLVPQLAGAFTIDVTDACGQQATVAAVVEICDTTIPNVFTPNGDDKNDTFEIFGILNFPKSTLQVYNRWGNLVYENANYTNKWSGDDLDAGVYFYTLTRSDGKTYEGYVHILRDK